MNTDTVYSVPIVHSPPRTESTLIPSPSQQLVDHTYYDFSLFMEKGGQLPNQKKSGNNFPSNLHRILSDENFSDIITWMPHGRTLKILDKRLLLSTVIPTYFGQTRFESFTRQLSNWGFKRLHQSGPDSGCYYHQCFLRGLPPLTALMNRKPRKKLAPNPESEPDFYLISNLHPLPPAEIASGPNSRSSPPVASQPVGMGTALVYTINRTQGERQVVPKKNSTMHSTHPLAFSSAVAGTGLAPNTRPLLQIETDVHFASKSTCMYDIPTCQGGDEDHFLMQAQPIAISSTTSEQLKQEDTADPSCNLFDGDYLRFLNLLVERLSLL